MLALLLSLIRSDTVFLGTNNIQLIGGQTYDMTVPADTYVIFTSSYNYNIEGYATCGSETLSILGSTLIVALSFTNQGTIYLTNTLSYSQSITYCAFTNRTTTCYEIVTPIGRSVTLYLQSGYNYCVYIPLSSGYISRPSVSYGITAYTTSGDQDLSQSTYYESHYFNIYQYSNSYVTFTVSETDSTLDYALMNGNPTYTAYKIGSGYSYRLNTGYTSRDYDTPSPSVSYTKSSKSFPFWVLGPIFSIIVFVIIVVVCCVCSYKICSKAVKSTSSSSSSSSSKSKNHKHQNNNKNISVTNPQTSTAPTYAPPVQPQPYDQNMQPIYYQPGYPTVPNQYIPPGYPSAEYNPYSADMQPNAQPAPYPNQYPSPYYPQPPQIS